MLIDAKCPHCRDVIPVTESASEQKIDCPGCGKKFPVPASASAAPKEKEKEKPKGKEKDRDRDDPRGKKSSAGRRSRRDDDDDDDDDDDRPRRRKEEESGSGMVGLLIFGGIGLVVLAVGFGIAAWLIFSKSDKPESASATKSENRPANTTPPQSNTTTPPKNVPGVPQKAPDNDPPIRPMNPKPRVEEPPADPMPPPRVEPPPKKEPEVPAAPPAAPEAPAVKLPAPATEQTAVGANGKYLFLFLKAERQIAVFDPAEKKIARYIQANDDEVLLAAGAEQLFVGYPNLNRIERIPYATLEADKGMEVPSKHPLRGLAIGTGATNPLLAACGNFPQGDEFFLIDVGTMRRFDNSVVKNPGVYPDTAMRVWASQDGRTFAATSGGLSKPHVYQMKTTGWVVHPVKFPMGGLSADGDTVLGLGQLSGASGAAVGEKRGDRGKSVWYFPAASGPYFCSLNERNFGQFPNEKKFAELQLHIGREQQPLVSFPELPELEGIVTESFFQQTKPLDRHIFFLPDSNMVAILPAARDRIHYRTVDVKEELAKTKIEYLAVTSRPPSVKFGQTFRYKPEVLCKKGPPVLRLDAAPVGMKLEGDTLVWTVPTRANQPPANVILGITDATGRELFHAFEVTVFAK